MFDMTTPLYAPAIRARQGELMGLSDLAPDVAERILPRAVIPPRGERDDELQRILMQTEDAPTPGPFLARFWQQRDVLLDPTYLIQDFGRERMAYWLPKMFDHTRKANVRAIPLISFQELLKELAFAHRDACAEGPLKLAVRISSGDMIGTELREHLLAALEWLSLTPPECAVIADFSDAEFGQPELVAGVIQGSLELLQELGLWRHIIFQGSNYPEKNPALDNSSELIPRNEWKAWRAAVDFDPSTAEHLIFGDYGADSSNVALGGKGGMAIRHLRYAIGEAWLVQRGPATGSHETAMRAVCNKILESGVFAGRSFSSADEFIYLCAKGFVGPGQPSKWRAVNTTHHITRAVTDVGNVRNLQFAPVAVSKLIEQPIMFSS